MKYALLIYRTEPEHEQAQPESGAMMGEYYAYTTMLQESGKMAAGEALDAIATATTVRVRDGQVQCSDGPFAETKEQLGGFYIIEADDLDEAIQLASKIPDARDGSVEVRPVRIFDNMPQQG